MTVKYNIIKNDDDFTDAWEKFATTVSDSWDWNNDELSLGDYKKYFNSEMVKEGMVLGVESEEFVIFKNGKELTMFLLRWA